MLSETFTKSSLFGFSILHRNFIVFGIQDSGTLVAPTPAERSASSRDVPGSGYANHLAATANAAIASTAPFLSSLSTNNPKSTRLSSFSGGSADQGVADAKSWMELARMGEQLCRSGTGDLTLISPNIRARDSFTNGSLGRTKGGDSNKRFLGSKNGSNNHNGNNNNNYSLTDGIKIFTNDSSWNTIHDRVDDSDSVWARGLPGPFARRHSSAKTASTGGSGSTIASNLPPRMLRKMASQAAGTANSNGFSDGSSLVANSSSDRSALEDRRPDSAWSDSIRPDGPSRSTQDDITQNVTPDIFQVRWFFPYPFKFYGKVHSVLSYLVLPSGGLFLNGVNILVESIKEKP